MARTLSTMLELGTQAPEISLPEPATGKTVSMADFSQAPALLVAFICNHCPFVIHTREVFAAFTRDYRAACTPDFFLFDARPGNEPDYHN